MEIEITCPRCGGTGQGAFNADCYTCSGRGRRPEPCLTQGSLRRWIKIAHTLASHPDSSAVEICTYLSGAYGRASVAGILGAMRDYGLVLKLEEGTPTRWRLTESAFIWQEAWCPECLLRLPNHKKNCNRPPAVSQAEEPTSAVVSELLGPEESKDVYVRQAGDRVEVTCGAERLTLNQGQAKDLLGELTSILETR